MKRRLLNLVTVVSLLLFVAVAVLWVRSYWAVDVVKLGSDRLYKAASGGGGVMLESLHFLRRQGDWRTGMTRATGQLSIYGETRETYAGAPGASAAGRGRRWERLTYPYTDRRTFWSRAWAGVERAAWPQPTRVAHNAGATFDNATGRCEERWFIGRAVWLPYWVPAAGLAILPASAATRVAKRRREARRRKKGLCPGCGYDLRGTPERCPECGMMTALEPS